MRKLLYGLIFLVAYCGYSFGQTESRDSSKYEIIKHDGAKYIGYILSDDGREILLFTDNLGKIYIPKSDIKTIRKIDSKTDYAGGKYVGEGILTTRYQFTTNAFPIKQGEHYAALNLYGPEVHFSVADNFSVGVMSTWIASPFVLALKYTVKTGNEKLNFGFGTLLGSTLFLNQARGFGGLHWAMATYGDRRNNVTLSAGYGYFNFDFFTRRFAPTGTFPNGNLPEGNRLGFTNAYKGPLLGLGMTFALNDRVSFIFDAMYVHASRKLFIQDVNPNYDNNGQWVSNTYLAPREFNNTVSSNLILMPGMRFQKKANRAFQVTLSGVIGKTTTTYVGTDWFWGGGTDRYSFPVPSCTWFFTF
jgi:hypothetical protein